MEKFLDRYFGKIIAWSFVLCVLTVIVFVTLQQLRPIDNTLKEELYEKEKLVSQSLSNAETIDGVQLYELATGTMVVIDGGDWDLQLTYGEDGKLDSSELIDRRISSNLNGVLLYGIMFVLITPGAIAFIVLCVAYFIDWIINVRKKRKLSI